MLNKNEGQILMADGSASQSNDADLMANGKLVANHISSSGGISKLAASTRVMGCELGNRIFLADIHIEVSICYFDELHIGKTFPI